MGDAVRFLHAGAVHAGAGHACARGCTHRLSMQAEHAGAVHACAMGYTHRLRMPALSGLIYKNFNFLSMGYAGVCPSPTCPPFKVCYMSFPPSPERASSKCIGRRPMKRNRKSFLKP